MRKTAKAYSGIPFSLLVCLIVAAVASGGPLAIGQHATLILSSAARFSPLPLQ